MMMACFERGFSETLGVSLRCTCDGLRNIHSIPNAPEIRVESSLFEVLCGRSLHRPVTYRLQTLHKGDGSESSRIKRSVHKIQCHLGSSNESSYFLFDETRFTLSLEMSHQIKIAHLQQSRLPMPEVAPRLTAESTVNSDFVFYGRSQIQIRDLSSWPAHHNRTRGLVKTLRIGHVRIRKIQSLVGIKWADMNTRL